MGAGGAGVAAGSGLAADLDLGADLGAGVGLLFAVKTKPLQENGSND